MLSYGLSAYASVMGGKISLEELVLEFRDSVGAKEPERVERLAECVLIELY